MIIDVANMQSSTGEQFKSQENISATKSFNRYSMHQPLQNKTSGLSSSLLSKLCSGTLLYTRHKYLPDGMNDK